MGLNAKQQRNVEILIDQHFNDLRSQLNEKHREPVAKVEVTPEVEALAREQAEFLVAQDAALLERITKFNESLAEIDLPPIAVPYNLTSKTPETVEQKTRGLIMQVTEVLRRKAYNHEEAQFRAAYERVSAEWQKAKRAVLIASLDGSEALTLIEGLIDLDTLLADTTITEEPTA